MEYFNNLINVYFINLGNKFEVNKTGANGIIGYVLYNFYITSSFEFVNLDISYLWFKYCTNTNDFSPFW